MKLNKKQGHFLTEMIDHWKENETISPDESAKLKESFSIRPFDWKKLAKYSFWIAIICVIISFGTIIADDLLGDIFENISDFGMSIGFGLAAAGIFYLGLKRRKSHPNKIFSNEAIMLIGVLLTAGALGYIGNALDTGSGHFSILFLLSTVVYCSLALWFPSKLIWIFSVLSLGTWFGTETGYISGWGAYFLGMNYPMRFVLFGGVLIGLSFAFLKIPKISEFYKPTFILGLLYFFIALWIMSIFGNYGDMRSWYDATHLDLIHWGLIFAAASIGAIIYGLKADDYTARSFGITFLFINLYTKFFEYFWDMTHKAILFSILALSFWLIGRKAESIWNLEFLKKEETKESDTANENN